MAQAQQLSPGASRLVGLVFVAAGVLPMLATFDIGPLGKADIHGPPWLAFAAGGSFAGAGLALLVGPRAVLWQGLFALLSLAGLAAVGSWVAFGVGERACSGGIDLPWVWSSGDLSGLACRIPFGLGALITDAFLCWGIVALLQRALGGPPHLARLLKAAQWLIMASVVPVLLPLLLLLLLQIGFGAVRTRLASGAWPSNEAFIARQKARGLLRGFGSKPPADSRHDET